MKQGCPLFLLLYALYLKPLCRLLLSKHLIRGFHLGDTQTKVVVCADNNAVIWFSREEAELVLGELKTFPDFSDAVPNQDKSLGSR